MTSIVPYLCLEQTWILGEEASLADWDGVFTRLDPIDGSTVTSLPFPAVRKSLLAIVETGSSGNADVWVAYADYGDK